MKKKVTYKLEQTKSIIVEVETAEQEQKIKEFNRDFERIDRQNRRIAAKTDSLERMYEETGYEVIDDGASPEEQYEQKELKNTIPNKGQSPGDYYSRDVQNGADGNGSARKR